ncbi:hypothetical protein I552_8710 [Mycobacterium xenopi 3993]|nr:hypothetical protein I552_8710 [Mycobacterium xenopi 3993]
MPTIHHRSMTEHRLHRFLANRHDYLPAAAVTSSFPVTTSCPGCSA